jgi:hypothetical protein
VVGGTSDDVPGPHGLNRVLLERQLLLRRWKLPAYRYLVAPGRHEDPTRGFSSTCSAVVHEGRKRGVSCQKLAKRRGMNGDSSLRAADAALVWLKKS